MKIFAYGSNLDARQMFARCPSTQLVCPATLPGWRVVFAGRSTTWGGAVASIRQGGAGVQGIVWEISGPDAELLDAFEGVPYSYERITLKVRPFGARKAIRVEAYAMHATAALGLPARRYIEQIGRAYRRIGFEPEPLYRALRESAGT